MPTRTRRRRRRNREDNNKDGKGSAGRQAGRQEGRQQEEEYQERQQHDDDDDDDEGDEQDSCELNVCVNKRRGSIHTQSHSRIVRDKDRKHNPRTHPDRQSSTTKVVGKERTERTISLLLNQKSSSTEWCVASSLNPIQFNHNHNHNHTKTRTGPIFPSPNPASAEPTTRTL